MRGFLIFIVSIMLASCGEDAPPLMPDQVMRAPIAPQQFALVPCVSTENAAAPCYLLSAGGKYYLLGAPEGALSNLLDTEIALLDGVLLFSLLPDHIDGLDTIRNKTWQRGREVPLPVIGPEGIEAFASAIDSAYEVPDAEYFALNAPKGGYDASLMKPKNVEDQPGVGVRVVDTGDLVIRGYYAPSGQLVYRVSYNDIIAAIGMCGGAEDEALLTEISQGQFVETCNIGGKTVYFLE